MNFAPTKSGEVGQPPLPQQQQQLPPHQLTACPAGNIDNPMRGGIAESAWSYDGAMARAGSGGQSLVQGARTAFTRWMFHPTGDYSRVVGYPTAAAISADAGVITTPAIRTSKCMTPSAPAAGGSSVGGLASASPLAPSLVQYALCPPTLFIRIAAFLGASAVTLGAYGAHVLKPQGYMATIFHTANLYHFLHTLLLFTVAYSRYPRVTGTLLTLGIIVFCGTCYLHVFTENQQWVQVTPYGGMLLIAAWTSFLL